VENSLPVSAYRCPPRTRQTAAWLSGEILRGALDRRIEGVKAGYFPRTGHFGRPTLRASMRVCRRRSPARRRWLAKRPTLWRAPMRRSSAATSGCPLRERISCSRFAAKLLFSRNHDLRDSPHTERSAGRARFPRKAAHGHLVNGGTPLPAFRTARSAHRTSTGVSVGPEIW
jgi:hypothetical protein